MDKQHRGHPFLPVRRGRLLLYVKWLVRVVATIVWDEFFDHAGLTTVKDSQSLVAVPIADEILAAT
jgi:hypothetical protein